MLNKGKQVLHEKPIYMEAERDDVAMEIALQYNDGYSRRCSRLRTTSTRWMAERTFRGFGRR